jgi:hypothetical protein
MPQPGTTAPTRWGGKRPGAGRKRTTELPLQSRELRLTLPQIAFLNRYGRGNLSVGARRLIDEAIARQQTTPAASSPDHPLP